MSNNAPSLPPLSPPPPTPPAKKKFCITIVFDSSLDECNTQDKLKTIIKQNFLFSGGGGICAKMVIQPMKEKPIRWSVMLCID